MPSDETFRAERAVETMHGKHAVVTGGARGIGLGIATVLADRGLRVSIVSRSASCHPERSDPEPCHPERSERSERSRRTKNASFFYANADVTDEVQVTDAMQRCRDANGPIAVLVNNSGIAESAPLVRTSLAMWEQILATNLTGTFLCTRAVIEDMIGAKWGRIVNVASTAGLGGVPYVSAYCASKHGVVGFTRALAAEFAGSGITANAVCPGYTETDMMRKALANIEKYTGASEEAARAHLAQSNPLGRLAAVEEIAQAVFELIAGDRTGAAVVIPGGAEA